MSTSMSQSQSNDRFAEEQATGISILIADNFEASEWQPLNSSTHGDIDASLKGPLARMIEEKDPSVLSSAPHRAGGSHQVRPKPEPHRQGGRATTRSTSPPPRHRASRWRTARMNCRRRTRVGADSLLRQTDTRLNPRPQEASWKKKEAQRPRPTRTLVVRTGQRQAVIEEEGVGDERGHGRPSRRRWSAGRLPREARNLARMSDVISINVAATTANLVDEKFCDLRDPARSS